MNIRLLVCSAVLASAGAWLVSRFAYRLGLLDIPNDRSSHSLPTPRGGGIGILLSFIIASFASGTSLLLWLPIVFVALVSLFDDKLNLTFRIRLLFQFGAALVILFVLLTPLPINPLLKFLLLVCLSVFIAGTANFFNFMDGINGIAGLTGTVGFVLLALFARKQGYDTQALVLLAVSCACLGFLPFNFPAARVFMGDVGSVLLGFLYAVSVVALARNPLEFLALAACLSTFYVDALTTLFIRWRSGERLTQAHRRHLYQLLANQMHLPHWQVSLGYAVIQALVGIASLRLASSGAVQFTLFLFAAFFAWCYFMQRIRRAVE